MKTETANETAELLTDLFEGLNNVQVEALFFDEDEWPIAPWKVEDLADEIASAGVVIRIFAEADDRRFADLNAAAEKQAAEMVAAAKEAGITLREQQGEILLRGGGIQINLEVIES